jgi:RNA polymerase-associated protein
MGSIATKRSVMTCFSEADNIYCHQVRIVLAEKGVSVEIIDVNPQDPPEELLMLNPYQSLPTLVDRDLVIYSSNIIMEYLDERFPHPPLLPVYPVARAKTRLMMSRIAEDWYGLVNKIESNQGDIAQAKKELLESLMSINSAFAEEEYFLSEDFSLVDCCIAPLLWRLPKYEIELPKQAEAIKAYQKRIFARNSFQVSLTALERTFSEQLNLSVLNT